MTKYPNTEGVIPLSRQRRAAMQTAVLTSVMGTGRCRPLALIEDLEAYQRPVATESLDSVVSNGVHPMPDGISNHRTEPLAREHKNLIL